MLCARCIKEMVLFLVAILSAVAPSNVNGEQNVVKKFKLSAEEIRPLATGYGACFATDYIVVNGLPVRFMYRETPDKPVDSGWRFMSGQESDDYIDDPENAGIYDVNTIANYDPSIVPFLDAPVGSVFEKEAGAKEFSPVTDWQPAKE